MNRGLLFFASCVALVTSAFTFSIGGDILQPFGDAFQLTQAQKGDLAGAAFVGMALSMLAGGFICDALGMKRIMWIGFCCHLIGILGTIFAPNFVGLDPSQLWFSGLEGQRYHWLYIASLFMGFGNGMVETAINPLAATMFPEKKTQILNILHAWWPGGLILGGLSVKLIGQGVDLDFFYVPGLNLAGEPWAKSLHLAGWQISMFLVLAPCLLYGLLIIAPRFPETERVASGVTTGDMLKEMFRPLFLFLCFCMLLTACTELGPQKWQESVMTRTAGVSGTLILVYTSGLMFIMRHFAGPLARAISPIGMLLVSSILSGVGLYLLSTATTAATAFGYATIFGIGIAYYWPTMLGVTAERFPKGGALLLCLMGSAGNLAISFILPIMGRIVDTNAVEKLKEQKDPPPVIATKDGKKSIDQDIVKHIELLSAFSPDELKTFDFKAWLTPDQQKKQDEMKAEDVKDWRDYADRLQLSTAQRLVLGGLFNDKLLDGKSGGWGLAPSAWQKGVEDQVAALVSRVATLRYLKGVAAAELTDPQRAELAKLLESKGVEKAADKVRRPQVVLEKDEQGAPVEKTKLPEEFLSKDKKALKAIWKDPPAELKLTPEQQKVLAEKKAVDEAEAYGYSEAFRQVAYLPGVLVVLFGLIWLYDRSKGGYKAERLGPAAH